MLAVMSPIFILIMYRYLGASVTCLSLHSQRPSAFCSTFLLHVFPGSFGNWHEAYQMGRSCGMKSRKAETVWYSRFGFDMSPPSALHCSKVTRGLFTRPWPIGLASACGSTLC